MKFQNSSMHDMACIKKCYEWTDAWDHGHTTQKQYLPLQLLESWGEKRSGRMDMHDLHPFS